MLTALFILLIADCVALVIVVLLQAGKGGGLAAGFGGAGTGMEMMGSRQTATFLHNATKWLGGAFLVISFVISLATVRGTRPRSLIESEMQDQQTTAPAPAPQAESPTDLQSILEGGSEGAPQEQPAGPPAGETEAADAAPQAPPAE